MQALNRYLLILTILLVFLAGCGSVATPASQVLEASATTAIATSLPPLTTIAPTSAPATPTAVEDEEAILILEPGPGSRVGSPLHVTGIADPTFEQNLVVRLLSADGTELAVAPTTIQAEAGQRGAFAIDLPLQTVEEQPVFLQVYDASPRDGGIVHLASVVVYLAPASPAEIKTLGSRPEQIQILSPTVGQLLSGGVIAVEGFGWASFEQTLVVELYDEQGVLLASQPIVVDSLEMGQPGPFRAELHYNLATPGAGRVVVRDPSMAFEGDVHVSSVEVWLGP